eukprot:scaffold270569_cov22-Tisochrysis_lutea.AAC.1
MEASLPEESQPQILHAHKLFHNVCHCLPSHRHLQDRPRVHMSLSLFLDRYRECFLCVHTALRCQLPTESSTHCTALPHVAVRPSSH